jgi:hypothetical protein
VRQRLETRYGKEASMKVAAEEELFRVTLSLPAEMASAPATLEPAEVLQAKEVQP